METHKIAIIVIGVLEGLNIVFKGPDGMILSGAIGSICALAGVKVGKIWGAK